MIVMDVGQPFLSRNLWLVPLYGEPREPAVVPLHHALADGRASVKETHQLDRLVVHNHREQPLLGVGGMELIGGFQNRILSQSVRLDGGERRPLETFCVEAGRWGGEAGFVTGSVAYPSLRSSAALGQTQNHIWLGLSRALTTLRATSATQSMHDLYHSVTDDVRAWVSELPIDEDQTGVLVLIGGRFLCGDCFANRSLFQAFWPMLANSYCVEGLLRRGEPGRWDVSRLELVLPALEDDSALHQAVFLEPDSSTPCVQRDA